MIMVAIFPLFFIQVIVFRGDYRPADVRLLSDLAWLPFVGLTGPSLVRWTCIGAVVLLGDAPGRTRLPRSRSRRRFSRRPNSGAS